MIANDIITRAFRLLNITASGETAAADQSQDALIVLNNLIADWSASQPLTLFSTAQVNYTASTVKTSFTIGPTGDLVTVRPDAVDNVFLRSGGVDYSITSIGEAEYQAIGLKSLISSYPEFCYYDATLTNGTLFLWPGISAGQSIFLNARQVMDQFAGLFDVVDIPPNYARALAYNLAIDLSDEYEIQPSPNIYRIAASSKRGIKRLNTQVPHMSNEAALLTSESNRINILSGR